MELHFSVGWGEFVDISYPTDVGSGAIFPAPELILLPPHHSSLANKSFILFFKCSKLGGWHVHYSAVTHPRGFKSNFKQKMGSMP